MIAKDLRPYRLRLVEQLPCDLTESLQSTTTRHALRDLSVDPRAALLSTAQLQLLASYAIEMGYRAADEVRGQSACELAAERRVEIRTAYGSNRVANAILRAEYDSMRRRIVVYRESMEDVAQRQPELVKAALEEIHIAHELFHCIEEEWNPARKMPANSGISGSSGRYVTDARSEGITLDLTWPPRVHVKGRFRSRSYVLRSSREIAAHAFAQRLLNLDFYPGDLDYEVTDATDTGL